MDSVLYLAWVEENDPDLFARIKERVAEGRWKIVGGWWIEPDCNLPGGESFVRQALYAQRYLLDRFGEVASVGCNVDPFGHNAALPQLLSKAGIDSYMFLRPGPHEMTLPGQFFWWRSKDGSRVLAYRLPNEYCSPGADIGSHIDKSLALMPPDEPELMIFYGVGNHGGGPTRANLDSIHRLDAADGLPRLPLSHPRAFLDSVASRGDIPEHAGELQHHGVGCYSAHSGIKRWNRRAENLLARAEKWSAVAGFTAGVAYPLAELTEAWKQVLFNQFHDILAGTSIAPAYEDARDQYGHACSLAEAAFNRAAQSVSRLIDIPAEPDLHPVVVFNPHPWTLREDVEFEFAGFSGGPARLLDDEGEPVPIQPTRSHAAVNGPRGRLVFRAEVPPLGYRLYRLLPAAGCRPETGAVRAEGTTLENEHLLVEIDPATGWLRRLHDKDRDAELMPAEPAPHAVVIDDRSDTWGHRVRSYDQEIGAFRPTRVRLVESGPVRAVLRVESGYEHSTLAEELVLSAGARHVHVRVVVDWHERGRLLKLRFPTALEGAESATYEIPYAHIERATDGAEEAAQSWVDVHGTLPDGGPAGLSVLNDGKYGHDVRGGEIGVTALRSPVYAWHEPKELDEDGVHEYLDQGRQEFAYRLVPHAGDWRAAGTVRLAAELNQRPFPLLESYHPGPLPPRAEFARTDTDAVVISVVKGAEDGGGALVVRAVEVHGRPARATLTLPTLSRVIEADFAPTEVKTFLVPADAGQPVVETDLLERPYGGGKRENG